MGIFTTHRLKCIKIFIGKSNWKETLNFLLNNKAQNEFFFFFESERGYNLTLFSTQISKENKIGLEEFIKLLPNQAHSNYEDSLFSNFNNLTIREISKIPAESDIDVPNSFVEPLQFLYNLSKVIIKAMNYNDFFLEEKNRINIALQLVFLSMVKINDKKDFHQSVINSSSENRNIDPHLIEFYEEIHNIEKEDEIEDWVLEWLELSSTIKNIEEIDFMILCICQTLEIRGFARNVRETLFSIVKELGQRETI